MDTEHIKAVQRQIGALVDGNWGPISTEACRDYLRRRMPAHSHFPKESGVTDFYGRHGVEGGFTPPMRTITLPFVIYYGNKAVRTLSVHEKCADSLQRAFVSLHDRFPAVDQLRAAGVLTYDGLYNPRLKRGSATEWSMHSWGIAIDLNAAHNGLHQHWPKSATMPLSVMECFAEQGWLPAGAFWSRDAMHFQATQP